MVDRVFKGVPVIREPQGVRVQQVKRDSLVKSVIWVIEAPPVLQEILVPLELAQQGLPVQLVGREPRALLEILAPLAI
jgi:hypothetical protein